MRMVVCQLLVSKASKETSFCGKSLALSALVRMVQLCLLLQARRKNDRDWSQAKHVPKKIAMSTSRARARRCLRSSRGLSRMCAVRFDMSSSFSPEYVKRLADLARLAMPEAEIAQAAERLQRIDAYVQMLRSSDLLGEEPLVHVGELANVLGADEPGAALSREALEALAPAMLGEFLSVPKVIDEGGGA